MIKLAIIFFLSYTLSWAQSATIDGTVKNESGTPVENARVVILGRTESAVTTSDGTFSIAITPGKHEVQVSAAGYSIHNAEVQVLVGNNPLQINLSSFSFSIPEIVVSAQKKEELLHETPIAVTVFDRDDILNYRLESAEDLSAVTSNLYSANPGDNRNVTSVRGIVSTSYEPAVATYIDGVNQFNLDTYIPQLFDVERIEILKGPQSTLYGRSSMGGVINIITRKPGNEANGFATVQTANFAHRRLTAGARIPIIKNKLFVGIAGMHEQYGGFYTNDFDSSRYDDRKAFAGNYYIRFLPTQKWSFTLNVKHSNIRNNGPFPLVVGSEEAFQNPFRLSQNAKTTMVDNTVNSSFSIDFTNDDFKFLSQSAWQKNYRYYRSPIDADFSPMDAISINNNYGRDWNYSDVLTQELNISSPPRSGKKFSWLAGTFLFRQVNPVKQSVIFGADATMIGAAENNFTLVNTSTGKGSGVALYGQANYSLTKQFELGVGLRYDREWKQSNVEGIYEGESGSFHFVSDTTASQSFSTFSPKVSLSYTFSPGAMYYASYSRGFRAGGLTPLSSDPSFPPLHRYDAEFSDNFEIGSKNSFWSRALTLNIALFYTIITDLQVPTLVLPDAITITRNTGTMISKGAEVELRAKFLRAFSLDFNFGYTDAVYEELTIAQGGEPAELSGKRQIFTPDFTSLVALQYDSAANSKKLNFTGRAEWIRTGTQYFDLANTINQPAYSLFNSSIGIRYNKVQLMFWGRNLLDKRYIRYGYDFGAVHLGDPATHGATLSYRF